MKSNRKDLVLFFVITFAWMWLLNLPRVLAAFDIITINAVLSTVLGYLAVFGPGIAAFILTGRKQGKKGLKTLWQNGWNINFSKKWLIPAIVLVPVAGIITWLILKWVNIEIPWEYGLPPAMIVPIGLLIWLLGAIPEEYGWRGYALPSLLEKMSPLKASLLLGLVWGIWHLPLHFIPTTTQFVIPIIEYILQIMVLTVIFTWLHIGTGGSIFIAGLFHAFGNITGAVIPYWVIGPGRWVSFALLLIPAVIIIIRWQNERQ